MSYQEIAKSMIDRLPEDKMIFVINMLEGLDEMSGLDLYPDFKPKCRNHSCDRRTGKRRRDSIYRKYRRFIQTAHGGLIHA